MHPVAFEIAGHVFYWYGVLIVVSLVLGELLLVWSAHRRGIPLDVTLLFILFLLLGGGVGARLGSLIRNALSGPASANPLAHKGQFAHGAFVGIALAGLLCARATRVSLWKLLDLAAPSIALGFAVTRIGCFLSGCCYGRPTDLPWGVIFPPFSPPWMAFGETTVHPTQLYASLGNLALFVVLLLLRRRERFDGFLFLGFIALYVGLRFILEVFRADPQLALGLTAGQLSNLVIGPLALVLLWVKRKRTPAPEP